MDRMTYFNYIEEKLNVLSQRIETRGKLNLLDLHQHSEDFYMHLLNKLFGFELENLNEEQHNVEAIDLVDINKKIILQVSATCTKNKVDSSLSKGILAKYSGYTFKFVSISKDASELRKHTFNNPYSVVFNPLSDIYDIKSILSEVKGKEVNDIKQIYDFIKDELGGDVDIVKFDSNLSSIINILSKENWDVFYSIEDTISFEIDRKIEFNELTNSKSIIKEYCVYYHKVDEKYSEFDSSGLNKSMSVLAMIKKEYMSLKDKKTADEIFLSIADNLKNKVIQSANYSNISIEELDLCIDILVVDAFIRCKIFENPEKYNYASTR